MNKKKNEQNVQVVVGTPENRVALTVQGDAWERAAAELRTACATIKDKKTELIENFRELDKQRERFGRMPMDLPKENNPFDITGINEAQWETGSPVIERRWAALAKAINASIFRDDDFSGRLIGALDGVRQDAIFKDRDLQAAVNAAKEAREQAVKAADANVIRAETALAQHRQRFADDFVKPVLEADGYGTDALPGIFQTPRGLRNIGLRFGADESIEAQVSTLWGVLQANTKPRPDGDPYYHLLHHDGEPVPGLSKGVAWSYNAGRGGKRSAVAGSDGYVRPGGPLVKDAPRPKRKD